MASLPKWEEPLHRLERKQLQLLTGKKDTNLRPVAQRTHEILARELVSIYEVKIPTR